MGAAAARCTEGSPRGRIPPSDLRAESTRPARRARRRGTHARSNPQEYLDGYSEELQPRCDGDLQPAMGAGLIRSVSVSAMCPALVVDAPDVLRHHVGRAGGDEPARREPQYRGVVGEADDRQPEVRNEID